MQTTQTEADFEQMSWHDCNIWRLDFMVGDPDEGDWTNDLVVGIDFIVEWLCGIDGATKFKIAPATLAFHGVTDPKIGIDWGQTGLMHEVSIHQILREPIRDQKAYPGRPYYRWRISLNWPKGGEISFGAVGFTQTLLAEPILCESQHLPLKERNRLMGR